jgi:hypothetical protein
MAQRITRHAARGGGGGGGAPERRRAEAPAFIASTLIWVRRRLTRRRIGVIPPGWIAEVRTTN